MGVDQHSPGSGDDPQHHPDHQPEQSRPPGEHPAPDAPERGTSDDRSRVQSYADNLRNSDFPVKVETVDGYTDFRPDAEYSYLTHRQLRFPVPTALFAPRKASLLGQEITTIDPRTLLHMFGTIGGVIRKKDVPKIVGLADAIKSGKAVSRFSERDCEVFSRYMVARKRQYPAFIATKRT
jgi:hypothetical protein